MVIHSSISVVYGKVLINVATLAKTVVMAVSLRPSIIATHVTTNSGLSATRGPAAFFCRGH